MCVVQEYMSSCLCVWKREYAPMWVLDIVYLSQSVCVFV